MNRIDRIRERAYYYQNAIFHDLSLLIKQSSWRDDYTISKENPFGQEIARTFDLMKSVCIREGLTVESAENYAFHTTLERSNPVRVAIACHLDTVPLNKSQKWNTNPLKLSELNNVWYGLGINDNKGSATASLYVLKN